MVAGLNIQKRKNGRRAVLGMQKKKASATTEEREQKAYLFKLGKMKDYFATREMDVVATNSRNGITTLITVRNVIPSPSRGNEEDPVR